MWILYVSVASLLLLSCTGGTPDVTNLAASSDSSSQTIKFSLSGPDTIDLGQTGTYQVTNVGDAKSHPKPTVGTNVFQLIEGTCNAELSPGESCEFQLKPSVTEDQNYNSAITLSDSTGMSVSGKATGLSPPQIASANCLFGAYQNQSYSCKVTASGHQDTHDTASWSIVSETNSCSQWLQISGDGVLTKKVGTFPGSGTCRLTVSVEDGFNSPATFSTLIRVTDGQSLSSPAAGSNFSCANNGGDLKCWGDNSYGQLGNGTHTDSNSPVHVGASFGAIRVATGEHHACALSSSGDAYCWGRGDAGRLGNNLASNKSTPQVVQGDSLPLTNVAKISPGSNHTCALIKGLNDGEIYCWGDNTDNQLGNTPSNALVANTISTASIAASTGFVDLSAGDGHSCAITTDQKAVCWGKNDVGQLGRGHKDASTDPQLISADWNRRRFVSVTSGSGFSCALDVDQKVYCWGKKEALGTGASEDLGDSERLDSLSAVNLTNSSPVVSVSAGRTHACALHEDGNMSCWGESGSQQLGQNNTTPLAGDSAIPTISSPNIETVKELSQGALSDHVCVSEQSASTGTSTKCWGNNTMGQIGTGSNGGSVGDMSTLAGAPVNSAASWAEFDSGATIYETATSVEASSGTGLATTNAPKNGGKWYFEFDVTAGTNLNLMRVGLVKDGATPTQLGEDGDSCGFDMAVQKLFTSNTATGSELPPSGSIAVGSTLGVAIDLDASPRKIRIQHGISQVEYTCNIAGDVQPAVSLGYADQRATANFTNSVSPPTGYFPGWLSE